MDQLPGDEDRPGEGTNDPSWTCGEMSSGDQTPMQNNPSAEGRGKKRVGWGYLPKVEDEEDPTYEGVTKDDEEKLAEISKTLSQSLPDYNRRKQDPPSFSPPTETAHDTLSPPKTKSPRSVLRSGTSTPQLLDAELNTGVVDLENKRRSQHDAASRARALVDDVSRESSPTRERRRNRHPPRHMFHLPDSPLESGQSTPTEHYGDYVPRPGHWRMGGLSALHMATRLFGSGRSRHGSLDDSGESTPTSRPSSPSHSRNSSTMSLTDLVRSSIAIGGSIGRHEAADLANARRPQLRYGYSDDSEGSKSSRAGMMPRTSSSGFLEGIGKVGKSLKPSRKEVHARIEKHIQETILRQRFLVKLCRALMAYGAPTHRLEEYMRMVARVLEVDSQFLYIPGCMIVSFDDAGTHTAEVKLVRTTQGVDLGKLRDTHGVYKEVVHDIIGVDEASDRLDEITRRDVKFSVGFRVLAYGFASATVGPFAFEARWIDMPIAFILGCILGFLQLILSNQNDLYSNLFELVAVLITSFLSRMFGSLQGGNLFCFSALAQSSIALILPGYTVLCGALELQAKSIVAGSVRLVYAIIYSLFIGFGLTLGTAIYGIIDKTATSADTCQNPLSGRGYWPFLFVPLYTVCLMIINQAKYKQWPVMLVISFGGYVVNYFSALRFVGNAQIAACLGALAIAFMANVYGRVGLHLDESVARLVERLKKWWRKAINRRKVPKINEEPPTPSYLEHQVEMDDFNSDSGLWLYRLSHFGRVPPVHRKLRASSDASSTPSEVADQDGPAKPKKSIRVHYTLAAAAMLPAIFVQVPSGLAVSGSLVQGITTGNQIARNSSGGTLTAAQVFDNRTAATASSDVAFTVGYSVLEVAIGLSVGLFLGTLVVYPTGKGGKGFGAKMRSGLFSF